MIAVWILSYLAVYMLGAVTAFVALYIDATRTEKRLRKMPPPKPEDGLHIAERPQPPTPGTILRTS